MKLLPTQQKKVKAILFVFYFIAAVVLVFSLNRVSAAGKTVTISPSSLSVSTATEVTYHYISSVEFGATDTVSIAAAAGVTVADCAAPTTDADGDTTTDGSSLIVAQTYTYLFSAPTTTASTAGVDFCVSYAATTGNYSITFIDSKANPVNNDYGGAFIYVGNANDVTITAQVQPILSFVIRNNTDTTNTNSCALGVLTPASVNTCSYRLKVGTNSSSGYVVTVVSDGDFRRSGTGATADSENIDRVTDESGSIASGTENYGIALTGNSASTGTAVTEATTSGFNFSTDDSPLPINGTDNAKTLYTSTTMNDPTTTSHSALVTHRATIDTGTLTGNYQQVVTYTVTTNF